MVRVRVRVRLFRRDLMCSGLFLKLLCSCKRFYCVLQRFRRFQYLLLWLWLGLVRIRGFQNDLVCSRGFLKILFS